MNSCYNDCSGRVQLRKQGNIHQTPSWPGPFGFWTIHLHCQAESGTCWLKQTLFNWKRRKRKTIHQPFTTGNTTAPAEYLAIVPTLSSSRCSWACAPPEDLVCWTWSFCWGCGLLVLVLLCHPIFHGNPAQHSEAETCQIHPGSLSQRSFGTSLLFFLPQTLNCRIWLWWLPCPRKQLGCLSFSQLNYNSSVLPSFTALF